MVGYHFFYQLFDTQIFDWSSNNGAHGNCDRFFVKGDSLFLDVDAFGRKKYHLNDWIHGGEGSEPSWPPEAPSDKAFSKYASLDKDKECEIEEYTYSEPETMISTPSTQVSDAGLLENMDDMKVGKIAQTYFRDCVSSKNMPYIEILQLQNLEYCKKTFGINFPVLVEAKGSYDKVRYYSKTVTVAGGGEYVICSQWFEKNKEPLVNYLKRWGFCL